MNDFNDLNDFNDFNAFNGLNDFNDFNAFNDFNDLNDLNDLNAFNAFNDLNDTPPLRPAECDDRAFTVWQILPVVVFLLLASQRIGQFHGFEDAYYMRQADLLWDRVEPGMREVFTGRIVLHWAAVLMHLVAGPTMYWSGILAGTIAGALTVGLLATRGGRFYGRRAAVVGALALATCPIFVRVAVEPQPEVYIALFWIMALLLYRQALQQPGAWRWLSIGLLIGLATLAKKTGVLMFPVLGAHLLWLGISERRGRYLKGFGGIVIGGAVALAVAVLYCGLWYGSPAAMLGHVRTVMQQKGGWEERLALNYRGNRWNYLLDMVGRRFALVGGLYLLTTVLSLWRGRARLEAGVGLFYLGFLLFGSISITHYKRMWYLPRYVVPLVPFFAVCFGVQAVRLYDAVGGRLPDNSGARRWWRRATVATGVVLLGGIMGMGALFMSRFRPVWNRTAMIQVAAHHPDRPAFAPRELIKRYRGVLSDETRRRLHPIEEVEKMPPRYSLVADNASWQHTDWSGVSWPHARIYPEPFDRTALRRIVDHLRGRDLEDYDRWYQPWFYRVEVDTTGEAVPERTEAPWGEGG